MKSIHLMVEEKLHAEIEKIRVRETLGGKRKISLTDIVVAALIEFANKSKEKK